MIPPQSSLVKYNSPILVSTTKEKTLKGKATLNKKTTASSALTKTSNQAQSGDNKSATANGATQGQSQSQTEDILNSILPPK
jgi:dynein light intermediate chain